MNHQREIQRQRQRRRYRVRNHLRGNLQRPRLSVFRSVKHIYCQIVDDIQGRTLVSASSLDRDLRSQFPKGGGNRDAAGAVGRALAQRASAAGIRQVRFDRGCYKYHGRVAALADAAREAGLAF